MIDDLLQVVKPGRYIGNETHMVKKDKNAVATRFVFCFPDVYEVGMSNLGLQLLYFFLNRRDDVYCERAFMPWTDMMAFMKQQNRPLWALETGDAISNFSFIGFTLQHEMSYTNVLAMLDLAGLPLRSADRTDDMPIVCAGGPSACNPEPMADFIDFFVIGDGEAVLDDIMDIYRGHSGSKFEFLKRIAKLQGVYVPALFEPGQIIKKAQITSSNATSDALSNNSLDNAFFPEKMLVPLIESTHHRAVLELFRGCKRGCRFCQAGSIGRPIRYRSVENLCSLAEALLDSTGHEEISLVSLSTSDYPHFEELLNRLLKITEKRRVNISLPSLRMDAVSIEALEATQKVRKSSLTFAPEAGTPRLRDVINKDITDQDISEGCQSAYLAGFDRVKLYFMTGLPTETDEDINGIAELTHAVVDEYYKLPREKRRRPVSVSASCSCFVPKPHTPFQWERQDTAEEFLEKQRHIKSKIAKKQISYRYHDAYTAVVEGVLARGDRSVGAIIEAAYRLGACFDSWSEMFRHDLWELAFKEADINQAGIHTKRSTDEVLPWEFIDMGVSGEVLLKERGRAYGQSYE